MIKGDQFQKSLINLISDLASEASSLIHKHFKSEQNNLEWKRKRNNSVLTLLLQHQR